MRRVTVTAIITTVAVLALWSAYREHKLTATFDGAALGMSESDLIGQLGAPWKSANCGQTFGDDYPSGCANEALHASPFAPVIPEYWAFTFSGESKFIGKYRYMSP